MGSSSHTHSGYVYILGTQTPENYYYAYFLESDVVGVKEKPLSYLLDIYGLLFTAKSGICLIEFRVSDPSLQITSALQLLTALFKQCK